MNRSGKREYGQRQNTAGRDREKIMKELRYSPIFK